MVYFQPEVGALGDLWVAQVDGGTPRRLVGKTFRGGDPVWTADGRRIVFWADLAGEVNLWSVPARGGEPQVLTPGPGRQLGPSLSADGSRLLHTWSSPTFTLTRRSSAGGERTLLPIEVVRPEVSPAGDRIAFSSSEGQGMHLFTVGADGGDVQRVTAGSGEHNIMPRWSADGSHLYFYQEQPGHSFRRIAVAGGDSEVVLESWSWHRQYDTAVGPRGERVVYVPIEDGMPRPLVVRTLETGVEHQLDATLLAPRWSADGTEILGYDADDRIRICPSVSGDCRVVAEGFAPRWGPQARSITFVRRATSSPDRDRRLSIWTLDLESFEGHQLTQIETASSLDLGYGFLAGGDLVWNRMAAGSEEPWLADVR